MQLSIDEFEKKIGYSTSSLIVLSNKMEANVQYLQQKKKSGGVRDIYKPAPELISLQQSLNNVLKDMVFLPDSMHGSIVGRSQLTNAQIHVGKAVVICVDIRDFFPNIHHTKIASIFEKIGFDSKYSKLLTKLTTLNYGLVQGFPTSSLLANLTLGENEPRLKSLFEENNVDFSIYVDDIAFSGGLGVKRFAPLVMKILRQCGFDVHDRDSKKFRIMTSEQQQIVSGLVVNEKLNVSKQYRRKVRSLIHNCLTNGIEIYLDDKTPDEFLDSLGGKVNHIRQINPDIGDKFLQQYRLLESKYRNVSIA